MPTHFPPVQAQPVKTPPLSAYLRHTGDKSSAPAPTVDAAPPLAYTERDYSVS